MPVVPTGILALVAVGEPFVSTVTLEALKYPLAIMVIALFVWWVYAERVRDKQSDARAAKNDETLDKILVQVSKEAADEPPGIPKKAMELSKRILTFAVEMQPFSPTYGLVTSTFAGPDQEQIALLRQFDAATRGREQERYHRNLATLFDKRFAPEVAQIKADFTNAGLGRKITDGIDREPKNVYDLQVLAEQIYGTAKTLRDCTPRPGYAPER